MSIGLAMREIANALPPMMPKVYEHFFDELPNECVGMIWADGLVTRLVNQARAPDRFSVGLPLLAEKLGEREGVIIAIYHSHPNGSVRLSSHDEVSMRGQWRRDIPIPWLLVTEDSSRLWYPEGPVLANLAIGVGQSGLVQV